MKTMLVIAVSVMAIIAVSATVFLIMTLPGNLGDYSVIRDAAMQYIWENHEEARALMGQYSWSYLGNGIFSSGGWGVVVKGSLSSANVTVDYSVFYDSNASIPHRIMWEGSYANGTILEISYTHAQ